jgi:hypothetical protein
VLAATAFAAPAQEGVVSAATPVFAWDGGAHNGAGAAAPPTGFNFVRCTPVYECEDTLVELKDGGDLTAEAKAGEGANDIDVAIYNSDADGNIPDDPPGPDDAPLAEDISTNKDAKTTAKKLKPGFYVIRVRFFDSMQGAYKGTATLKTAVAPAPAPALAAPAAPAPTAAPAPEPASKPTQSKAGAKERKACQKKAKKIKNKRKRAKALKRCKR